MTEDKINCIGVWTIRAILVIGIITLGVLDKTDAAVACGWVCFLTFMFL